MSGIMARLKSGLSFQNLLLLAPLSYAIHHGEEHLVLNFREWRLRYFPDNNALSTEAVLVVLISISLVFLFLNATLRTRVSASVTMLFLMATQVHNALFHLGGTILLRDFSPGLYTALLLYLPVNLLIASQAVREGLADQREVILLFLGGGAIFWAFECLGPIVLVIATALTWGWALRSARTADRVG